MTDAGYALTVFFKIVNHILWGYAIVDRFRNPTGSSRASIAMKRPHGQETSSYAVRQRLTSRCNNARRMRRWRLFAVINTSHHAGFDQTAYRSFWPDARPCQPQ